MTTRTPLIIVATISMAMTALLYVVGMFVTPLVDLSRNRVVHSLAPCFTLHLEGEHLLEWGIKWGIITIVIEKFLFNQLVTIEWEA